MTWLAPGLRPVMPRPTRFASSCVEPPRPAAPRPASSRPIPHPGPPHILLTSRPVLPGLPQLGPHRPETPHPTPSHLIPLGMASPLPWPPPMLQTPVAAAAGAAWNEPARGMWGRMRRGGLGGGYAMAGIGCGSGRDEAGGARSGGRGVGQGGLRQRRVGRGSTGRRWDRSGRVRR